MKKLICIILLIFCQSSLAAKNCKPEDTRIIYKGNLITVTRVCVSNGWIVVTDSDGDTVAKFVEDKEHKD